MCMALKALAGASPGLAVNGLNYIYERPLMPCGPGFLNGDVPPSPFSLSPLFNMVTGLAFTVWFGFLTEKSRP